MHMYNLKYSLQCLIITRNFQVLFLNTLKLRVLTRVYYMEINFFPVTFFQKVMVKNIKFPLHRQSERARMCF